MVNDSVDAVFTPEDLNMMGKWANTESKNEMITTPIGWTPAEIIEEVKKGTKPGYEPPEEIKYMVESYRKTYNTSL